MIGVMAQPVEVEIKLAASPAMLEKLRMHPQLAGEDQTAILTTTYFDTIDGKLRRGGAALRIRDGGKNREQTLKLALPRGKAVNRNEWNVALPGAFPEPAGFPGKARSTLVRLLNGEPLTPVATTRIERTVRRLSFGGSAIEIAFDVGSISAGGREESVCELELELVEGNLADVLSLALQLPLGPELNWAVISKAERCHALAFDLRPEAAHARPVKLSSAMDVAHGFQTIAWNCLGQLLANYPLVIASGDPEALHQARVAMRRLRAAGSLFRGITDDDAGRVLRAELKAAASALGPARDLHVLHERVTSAAKAGEQNLIDVLAHLAVERGAAVTSAQAMLAAEPFQRLLCEFAAWVEVGEWQNGKDEAGADQPLAPFAKRVLSRRRRRLRRMNDRLADLSDADRHRLRIDVKKLRYASDFFVSLFADRARAKNRHSFFSALSRLQDSLGELNDMAAAAAGREALFAGLEPITAARQAAQLDGVLAEQRKSHRKLFRAAETSLAKVSDARAWWKTE